MEVVVGKAGDDPGRHDGHHGHLPGYVGQEGGGIIDAHPGANIIIDCGSFQFGGDARTPGANKNSTAVTTSAAGDAGSQLGGGGDKGAAKDLVTKLGVTQGSFEFPLLSDPSKAFGLLTGKDVDLFIYNMPSLDLAFDYVKSFPLGGGLNVRFGGGVHATTILSGGVGGGGK